MNMHCQYNCELAGNFLLLVEPKVTANAVCEMSLKAFCGYLFRFGTF
jgi:hypothetical protein